MLKFLRTSGQLPRVFLQIEMRLFSLGRCDTQSHNLIPKASRTWIPTYVTKVVVS